MIHRHAPRFVALTLVALVACGDDSNAPSGGGGQGGGSSDGGGGGHEGGAGAGGVGGGGGSGPSRLPGDKDLCPAPFQTGMPAGQSSGFTSAGQDRSFHLLVPEGQDGLRPLVVAFHGTGLSGEAVMDIYGLRSWVDAGAVVVAPDSNGNGSPWPVWDSVNLPGSPDDENADLQLFDDLVQCIAAHYEIDATRVYVLGQSAGGAMSNFLLGHRSSLLAGGIPASGAFDFTQPSPPEAVSPMTVIVTWGGDNDVYTGSAGEAFLENMSYAEQSSIASQYWESQPGSHQVACKGAEVGHNWLDSIGDWMRDFLFAHPKGMALIPGETLPPLPDGAAATCFEEAATFTPPVMVDCPTSSTSGCQAYCQMLGDCLVENGTLGPVLADMLIDIGFAETANVCTGCIDQCEADAAGSPDDATALSCIEDGTSSLQCGPGFAGAGALQLTGQCCASSPGSNVCARFCAGWTANPIFNEVFPVCP